MTLSPLASIARSGKNGMRMTIRSNMGTGSYHFSRLIWSTLVAILPRNTTMMIASPTAASPAAMAITNRDMIWPASESRWWANATRLRLAPFSMISTHMSTMMKFRRTSTPTSPVTNRIALTWRGRIVNDGTHRGVCSGQRDPVRDGARRGARPAELHHRAHVRRDHAERGQPQPRGVRPPPGLARGPDHVPVRDRHRGRGSRRGAGDHHRRVPRQDRHQRGPDQLAQMVMEGRLRSLSLRA